MDKYINNRQDLEREVSGWLENVDMEFYEAENFDSLVDLCASKFLDKMREEIDFKWGDDISEYLENMEDDEFWNILKDFEKKNKDGVNIITLQQETAYKDYLEYKNEMLDDSMLFWEWYNLWCLENGLFDDRASFQYDLKD